MNLQMFFNDGLSNLYRIVSVRLVERFYNTCIHTRAPTHAIMRGKTHGVVNFSLDLFVQIASSPTMLLFYLKVSFVVKDICKGFFAKDIQSRCRNFREMKDVFKELKVLGRKRKSCTAQINKDILEIIFTSTSTFNSTIISNFFKN